MASDRLEHIEATLDSLVTGQEELRAGQEELRAGQVVLSARVDDLHKKQDGFERRLSRVEIVQEEMRDSIKLIAEAHGATQTAMARGFEMLKEYLDRRLDPLERAVQKLMSS